MNNKYNIKTIFFFNNGNTAVCDRQGNQMPEAQKSWMVTFLKELEAKGYFIYNEDMEIILPDGQKVEIFNTTNGINWKVKE